MGGVSDTTNNDNNIILGPDCVPRYGFPVQDGSEVWRSDFQYRTGPVQDGSGARWCDAVWIFRTGRDFVLPAVALSGGVGGGLAGHGSAVFIILFGSNSAALSLAYAGYPRHIAALPASGGLRRGWGRRAPSRRLRLAEGEPGASARGMQALQGTACGRGGGEGGGRSKRAKDVGLVNARYACEAAVAVPRFARRTSS